jgi:hypothetical protein
LPEPGWRIQPQVPLPRSGFDISGWVISLSLKGVEKLEGDVVWLRYNVI